jgi:hypothetical protein
MFLAGLPVAVAGGTTIGKSGEQQKMRTVVPIDVLGIADRQGRYQQQRAEQSAYLRGSLGTLQAWVTSHSPAP